MQYNSIPYDVASPETSPEVLPPVEQTCTPLTPTDQLPVALTVYELADVLGIGLNSAYQLVHSGKLRTAKIGRQYRISKDSLLRFLNGESE